MAKIYSASAVERAVISCFLELQVIAVDPKVNMFLEVLFLSSTDPAQSLSVKPLSLKSETCV